MPKNSDTTRNYLNINELPPPVGGGKETDFSSVNPHIIRLVSHLLDMADADYTLLTPIDKETLRDVLHYGSVERVARLQKVSRETIRSHTVKAIDALTRQIRVWEAPHQKLVEQSQRIQELEKDLATQKRLVTAQVSKHQKLEEENSHLRLQLNLLQPPQPQTAAQSTKGMIKVAEPMKRLLNSPLEEIRIPSHIVSKLNAHDIRRVYDLVRFRESHLARLEGITYSDLSRINRCLTIARLHLDTDVRWLDAQQEYYMKK